MLKWLLNSQQVMGTEVVQQHLIVMEEDMSRTLGSESPRW